MSGESKLQVTVSYGDVKAEFSGPPEVVMVSVNRFLAKQIPTLALAEKIYVSYPVADLIERFSDFVKLTPEGPRIWSGEHKLSDKELICLQLTAARIGYETGRLEAATLAPAELQTATSLNPKSVSSRLSEVSKVGYVEREQTEHGMRYKITTQGVHWLSTTLEKKTSSRG